MLITRYIIDEVAGPFMVITTVLVLVYAGYSASSLLAEAAAGQVYRDYVLHLVILDTVRVLEFLLPTALYFSLILGLGRIHRDSEMIAFMACGYSDWHVLRAVLYLSLVVALLVGLLATVGRPAAFRMMYDLEARAANELDAGKLQAGVFTTLKHSDYTLYAGKFDANNAVLEDVLFQTGDSGGRTRLISADTLRIERLGPSAMNQAEFREGRVHLLDRTGHDDAVIEFAMLRLLLRGGEAGGHSRRKAVATEQLMGSSSPREIAELQWRLASPLNAVLLSPLSRVESRQHRYARIGTAVVVYALFFNLTGVARTWVEQGRMAAVPGIWWVHALCAVLFLWLLLRHRAGLRIANR
jgi:lipopolysaccharide export system permease protein